MYIHTFIFFINNLSKRKL